MQNSLHPLYWIKICIIKKLMVGFAFDLILFFYIPFSLLHVYNFNLITVQYNNFAVSHIYNKGMFSCRLSTGRVDVYYGHPDASAITLITQRSCDLSHDPLSYWTYHHQIAKTTCIGCAVLLIQVSEGKFISAAYL